MRMEFLVVPMVLLLTSCSHMHESSGAYGQAHMIYPPPSYNPSYYASRLPASLPTNGKKLVYVDPNVHAWGAYDTHGNLIRGGIATSGGEICPPDAESTHCKTSAGRFRITSIGGEGCFSKTYPRPTGGGLMPYCMYFNGGQALHGSPADIVTDENVSHGCVRMMIPDAEWLASRFATVGTNVVVARY